MSRVAWGSGPGENELDDLDRVMEELVSHDELIDPTLAYDAGTRTVEFEVIVDAEDPLDAMSKASSLIRVCLHAAGVGTPGWPHTDDIRQALQLSFETRPSITPLVDA